MELAGDEKRIQALFSEQSLRDARTAPDFGKLWREAVVTQPGPRFRKSLVLATAAVIVAVTVLFLAWHRNTAPVEQQVQNVAPATIPEPAQAPKRDNKVVQRRAHAPSNRRRTLARRQQREPALQLAAMLTNWKSPTEQLMTAPTSSVFTSLPQLDSSVKDLQTFLSMKESNE